MAGWPGVVGDRNPLFNADGKPWLDAERLTGLVSLLRETILDELPQLWNVLKDDKSLVGPRSLVMQYLPFYSPEQGRRHEVKPGITGWAQANGRNAISWEDKFLYDVWYVDHWSLWLDLKILMLTLTKVLRQSVIIELQVSCFRDLDGSCGGNARSRPIYRAQGDSKAEVTYLKLNSQAGHATMGEFAGTVGRP